MGTVSNSSDAQLDRDALAALQRPDHRLRKPVPFRHRRPGEIAGDGHRRQVEERAEFGQRRGIPPAAWKSSI